MKRNESSNSYIDPQRRMVSLRSLAIQLDAHRTSVRRWLAGANIRPISFGSGQRGAIRYLRSEVDQWLLNRKRCD
jgi:hypothetical protein